MNGPALKIHAGFISHPALQLLAGQVVAFTVFDEHSAGLDKAEGHIGIHAFLPERLDPIEIAGAGTMTCSSCPAERYCRMLTGPMKGAHMMPLCLKGRSNRMGMRSSARR